MRVFLPLKGGDQTPAFYLLSADSINIFKIVSDICNTKIPPKISTFEPWLLSSIQQHLDSSYRYSVKQRDLRRLYLVFSRLGNFLQVDSSQVNLSTHLKKLN